MTEFQTKTHDEWAQGWRKGFSDAHILRMELSVRTWNGVLNMVGHDGTIEDICAISLAEWAECPNLGRKSIGELRRELAKLGYRLKGDIPPEQTHRSNRLLALSKARAELLSEVTKIEVRVNGTRIPITEVTSVKLWDLLWLDIREQLAQELGGKADSTEEEHG